MSSLKNRIKRLEQRIGMEQELVPPLVFVPPYFPKNISCPKRERYVKNYYANNGDPFYGIHGAAEAKKAIFSNLLDCTICEFEACEHYGRDYYYYANEDKRKGLLSAD